jgi:hypothetical protein
MARRRIQGHGLKSVRCSGANRGSSGCKDRACLPDGSARPHGDERGLEDREASQPGIQNSTRACNAIMRGELSPPKPTPSRPVGGEVV